MSMRFEFVDIGSKFACPIGNRLVGFEKKSLSSAYVLDPQTLERGKDGNLLPVIGFSKAVWVSLLL